MSLLKKGVPGLDYYSDFTIEVRNKLFYVHRVRLASKSEKFRTIFDDIKQAGSDNQLIVDYDPVVYEKFIKILYGWNWVEWYNTEKLSDLLAIETLAREYLCTEIIIDTIASFLCEQINITNYHELLEHPNKIIKKYAEGKNKILEKESTARQIYENFIKGNLNVVNSNDRWYANDCRMIGFNVVEHSTHSVGSLSNVSTWVGEDLYVITNPFGASLNKVKIFDKYSK